MDNTSLYSINLERNFLGGLINHSSVFADIEDKITNKDFYSDVHGVIFDVIKQIFISGKKLDKVILAQKIKDLGFRFKDEIEIFQYIEDISFTQITEDGIKEGANDLIRLRVRRELYNNAEEVKKFVIESTNKTISQITDEVYRIYNKKIDSIEDENDDPIDLFSGIEQYIREMAENPVEDTGLITPYSCYNKYFGGLQAGDGAYVFAGRSSEGKSVFMFNFSKGISLINNCKVLLLDSEMSLRLNQDRAAAAQAGVNPFYLRNGQWIKNGSMAEKVLKSFPEFTKYNGLFFHKYVPNKNIKEILSIARKWYYKYVGRGNKAIIVMDYLKVTTDADKSRSEWAIFGDKISYLNELGADLNIPIIVGAQQNRTARTDGVRLDDDTTIGGSDRINQFARFCAIFRRKTLEEISEQGTNFGTHLLKPVKWSRDSGKEDYNQNSYVKITDHHTNKTKYHQNYINYNIFHYLVQEKGSLQDIIQHHNFQADLTKNSNPKNDGSIDI